MNTAVKWVIGVVVVLALIAITTISWLVGTRNNLVNLQENVNTAWAQVETQYQRRNDLIPQLVSTVSGVAAQERAVFTEVARLRSQAGQIQVDPSNPEQVAQFMKANNQLTGALSRLMVVVEKYPELRSQENFMALQAQIEGTENRISVERGRYNETTTAYNKTVRLFPGSIVASMFGFERMPLFEADEGAEDAPKVDFGISEPTS